MDADVGARWIEVYQRTQTISNTSEEAEKQNLIAKQFEARLRIFVEEFNKSFGADLDVGDWGEWEEYQSKEELEQLPNPAL